MRASSVDCLTDEGHLRFKNIVSYAHSLGIELGAYQLLRNARSATFLNGAAPADAADHAAHPNAGRSHAKHSPLHI